MTSQRRTRIFLMPTLPVVVVMLVVLGYIALQQAFAAGGAEFWLMVWLLAFVVGLPLLVIVLAVAGALQRGARYPGIIPNTGVKIPGAGQ